MADRRRSVAVGLISFVAASIGAVALAAITAVDGPADVSQQADRLGVIGTPPGSVPTVGGCAVFPADNPWNSDISGAPRHPLSDAYIAKIQSVGGDFLHPDFGENQTYGIPFSVVPADEPLRPITYTAYGDESDPGPFPIPLTSPIEGGSGADGDRHVIVVRQGTCELFELFRGFPVGSGWEADAGARWNLTTGALRPIGWTSADAAGLPILPGLVRYDEVAAGEIRHAIRITFSRTQRGFILPATHFASSRTDVDLPPMGLRLRLRADYDIGQFTGQARVIAVAMQRYGVIVADNGSNWYFQGATDPRWDDDDLNQLKAVPGTAFEVVDTGPVRTS